MLRIFWEGHDPTQGMRQGNDVGSQYRSAIYWHGQRQFDLAVSSRDMFDAELRRAGYPGITTDIHEAGPFYYAEDYHQQYLCGEPERLLRPGRDGRELSYASDSGERVTTGVPAGIVPSRASSATCGASAQAMYRSSWQGIATYCERPHRQVRVELDDVSAYVDVGIADLILACWARPDRRSHRARRSRCCPLGTRVRHIVRVVASCYGRFKRPWGEA